MEEFTKAVLSAELHCQTFCDEGISIQHAARKREQ
jgi:hypothetical protein